MKVFALVKNVGYNNLCFYKIYCRNVCTAFLYLCIIMTAKQININACNIPHFHLLVQICLYF